MKIYEFRSNGKMIRLATNDDGSGLFAWNYRQANWQQQRGTVQVFATRAAVRKAFFGNSISQWVDEQNEFCPFVK